MQSNKVKGFRFVSKSLKTKVIFFPRVRREVLSPEDFPIQAVWLRLVEDYERAEIPYEMINDPAVTEKLNYEAREEVANWGGTLLTEDARRLLDASPRQTCATAAAFSVNQIADDDELLFDIGNL